MKTYKNLFQKMQTEKAVIKAISDATHGRRKWKRKDVKKAFAHLESFITDILNSLEHYQNAEHTPKEIYDGISRKKRTILAPTYKEQVMHHMIVKILEPMFWKGAYDHAYGSLPGRGVHAAKRHIERWIKKDSENCKYCIKMDIKKYFESIPHDVLKQKLNKQLKDKQVKQMLFTIIDVTNKGLPLGFYTSQWLAMWYLQDFDHFVKEQCYAPHYVRYMDDLIIFGADKYKLKETLTKVKQYLGKLGLQLNQKTQLFVFSNPCGGRDLDFMGFRFYYNRTILRKNIMYKMCRKAQKISIKLRPTLYEVRQIMSYLSWLHYCNIYNVWVDRIEGLVNIHKSRRRVSWFDKTHKITRSVWEEFEDVVQSSDGWLLTAT